MPASLLSVSLAARLRETADNAAPRPAGVRLEGHWQRPPAWPRWSHRRLSQSANGRRTQRLGTQLIAALRLWTGLIHVVRPTTRRTAHEHLADQRAAAGASRVLDGNSSTCVRKSHVRHGFIDGSEQQLQSSTTNMTSVELHRREAGSGRKPSLVLIPLPHTHTHAQQSATPRPEEQTIPPK